jgi:hypothetical protein
VTLEEVEHLQKVEHRPRQTVVLVDNDRIDETGFDICEETLQRGTFEIAPAVSAVVVAVRDGGPSSVDFRV